MSQVDHGHDESSTVSQRLATWTTELRFEDVPTDVVELTKLLLLDQLGLQLRGSTLPHVAPVLAVAKRLAGPIESTITGASWRASAPQAAWVNGTLGHSTEFDDAHLLAWHAMSTCASASLALAEAHGRGGRDLITAMLVGSQTMSLLGSVASAGMQVAGWHGSKVLGAFGATAAAGRLLGLDAPTLQKAFGIAGSDASGVMEYDRTGGEVKRLHAGSAARSGVEAALLAQAGFTGPPTIFEGPRGLFAMFGGTSDTAALDAAWHHWHVRDSMFRLYPAVATVHSPIAATERLRDEHAVDWRRVAEIRVGVVDFVLGHGATIVRPRDFISAQFSLAHSLALTLVRGANGVSEYFDPSLLADPDVAAVADLVRPWALTPAPGESIFTSDVEIVFDHGASVRRYEAGFPGHTSNPASPDQVRAKFRANADGVVPAAQVDMIEKLVDDLENLDTVEELAAARSTA